MIADYCSVMHSSETKFRNHGHFFWKTGNIPLRYTTIINGARGAILPHAHVYYDHMRSVNYVIPPK